MPLSPGKYVNIHRERTLIKIHRKYVNIWNSLKESTKKDIISVIDEVAWGKRKGEKLREIVLDADGRKIPCFKFRTSKLRVIFCVDYKEKLST